LFEQASADQRRQVAALLGLSAGLAGFALDVPRTAALGDFAADAFGETCAIRQA